MMKKKPTYTQAQWEAVCNRCGKCCLIKLEDEDTGEVYYTNVVCRYFDAEKRSCTVYDKRTELVPTCLKLTPENIDRISWMPQSCAYRCLFENRPNLSKTNICGRCISEDLIDSENLEDYIVDWEDL